MDHASDAMMKSMLRQSPLGQRRSVDKLKLWIRASSYATLGLFQGSVLMQIGAVNDGGMSKKGKSKTARAKGKDKIENKSSDSGKNKERDGWNRSQKQVQFQGSCSHCSKWRHKREDCRTWLALQNNGAVVAGFQEPDAEGG